MLNLFTDKTSSVFFDFGHTNKRKDTASHKRIPLVLRDCVYTNEEDQDVMLYDVYIYDKSFDTVKQQYTIQCTTSLGIGNATVIFYFTFDKLIITDIIGNIPQNQLFLIIDAISISRLTIQHWLTIQ